MGDYAASARPSLFVDEKSNHPAELLPFTGHKLIVLPELPRGALRSDLLKSLTGGDAISVRGMRQNPRTETPSAMLMFSANELPSIRMVDNALRSRLMIWPFDNRPAEIDQTLSRRLLEPEHLAGVVNWLMAGLRKCIRLEQQAMPMPIPDAVEAATADYFQQADVLGQWADEWLEDGGETPATDLYRSFVVWCEERRRRPLSETSFGLWMGRHYERRRTGKGNFYPVTLITV